MNTGEIAVLRGLGLNQIAYALPVIVVQDVPEMVVLFWRAGTRGKWLWVSPEKKVIPLDVISGKMTHFDKIWTDTDVLMLAPAGAAWAVYVMWKAGQQDLLCWYINLQQPLMRTKIGFDTQDYWLDMIVSPDRTAWRWKDEDQLEQAVALGMYSEEKAREIRTAGENALEMIRTNQKPFCDCWNNWKAPEAWKIPELPPGWDQKSG